jgi:hypothetical protein
MISNILSRHRNFLKFLALLVVSSSLVQAHALWLISTDYHRAWPDPRGRDIVPALLLSWGHALPFDAPPSDGMVSAIAHQKPDGSTVTIATGDAVFPGASFSIKTAGAHFFISGINPQWRSVVVDAHGNRLHQSIPKDAVNPSHEVLAAYYRVSYAKALLVVGKPATLQAELQHPVGHEIEILPLANPADIKPGDFFPVKILFQGQPAPIEATEVLAHHEAHRFLPNGEGSWNGSVDAEGKALIPLDKPGLWKVTVSRRVAAPERVSHKVDELRYQATLTFQIPNSPAGY